MNEKLHDGETRLMEILWEQGPLPAKEISRVAAERVGWSKNTTYTVLTRLVEKGVLRRDDPHFVCTPLVSREQARLAEANGLVKRLFGGSRQALFSALVEEKPLTEDEIAALRDLIDRR